MNIRKKSWIAAQWLKLRNPKAYAFYKHKLLLNRLYQPLKEFSALNKRPPGSNPLKLSDGRYKQINLFHSGNAGDLIYSLPVARAIFEITGLKPNLLLAADTPVALQPGMQHPRGNVILNDDMIQKLVPLLSKQVYLNKVLKHEDQRIDIDLSLYRICGIQHNSGSIPRWYFYTTGIYADLGKPWLDCDRLTAHSNTIVIARSTRYHNHLINYSFLSQYRDLLFVGPESEFFLMQIAIPQLKWYPTNDFLAVCQVINSCRLFIGNQSLPYAIAEALKVPRLLEVCPASPNVIPEGPGGHDFYFQQHFEHLVAALAPQNMIDRRKVLRGY